MTIDLSRYPAHLAEFRYLDAPRDAVPVRGRARPLRQAAILAAAAAIVILAAISFARAAGAAPARVVDGDPAVPALPAVEWRPSLIPDQGGISLAIPKPGDVIFTPKPPGRVPSA
jgi:hypothetical protein